MVFGITLLAGLRNPEASDPAPNLVKHFRKHRAEIERFVTHYRGLSKGERYKFPRCFDIGGWGYEDGHYPRVTDQDDCVFFDWRWGPPFSVNEFLIHSPRGLAGIPEKYRQADVNRYRIERIDDEWFFMVEL